MAVTPGHTAIDGEAIGGRTHPAREVPPIELPAPADELAAAAAARLGWDGVVLPQQRILGRNVCVVARLRTDVHAERIATGVEPVTERATVATWAWPELAGTAPEAAVEIVGVLAVERHWRTALAGVAPFARYGDAAMVLPSTAVLTRDYIDNCLPRARIYGVAVVSADVSADEEAAVGLDLASHTDRAMLGQDELSRWVNELVYAQLLATADISANAE